MPSQIVYQQKMYEKFPNKDFIFHLYHCNLPKKEEVTISPNEHKGFKWVLPKEALKMNLMPDLKRLIQLFYKI